MIVSPIIIIGMHRSGTSMLTQILEQLNLFIGKDIIENHESKFFGRINQQIMERCDGDWDNPKRVPRNLEKIKLKEELVEYVRSQLRSTRVKKFLGSDLFTKYKTLFNLETTWGWKNPRNTFTLPIWLEIFPEAKIIHICRHGVDVTNSLKTRLERAQKQSLVRQIKEIFRFRYSRSFSKRLRNFRKTQRVSTLEGGFSLWEEYMQEARKHIRYLGGRAIEIKYEDFLKSSHKILKSVVNFCYLSADNNDIERVTKMINEGRINAYRHNPELQAFADQVKEQLKIYGYSI